MGRFNLAKSIKPESNTPFTIVNKKLSLGKKTARFLCRISHPAANPLLYGTHYKYAKTFYPQ